MKSPKFLGLYYNYSNDLITVHFVSTIIIAVAGRQPVFIQLITNFNRFFFNPLVIQGLLDLPLILIDLIGACLVLILLLVRIATVIKRLPFSFLNSSRKAVSSNLLKSLISMVLGKGLSRGSYERLKTGK